MLALIPCVGCFLALAMLIGASPEGILAPFIAFSPAGLATLCFAF